jgi:hypothetical protein
MEAAMSLKTDSITWQSWARKWGDWRTWFPKLNGLREPMQRDLRFRVVAIEKPPPEKVQEGSVLSR